LKILHLWVFTVLIEVGTGTCYGVIVSETQRSCRKTSASQGFFEMVGSAYGRRLALHGVKEMIKRLLTDMSLLAFVPFSPFTHKGAIRAIHGDLVEN